MIKPTWVDPFSPEALRAATSKILSGMNYRLFFDGITRSRLLEEYAKLTEIAKRHPNDDEQWRKSVREQLTGLKSQDNLRHWLIGLARKTAQNLDIASDEYPQVFDMLMKDISEQSNQIRETALLLWAGAATLTIRGSMKSKVGNALEKCLARAALHICGLNEEDDFRINIAADEEVSRQTDAEIKSPRGRIRMEVGLIGRGNPEVIGDKIERMGRNGIVLFDKLSGKSQMWENAKKVGVKLIQLRNNNAVEELRKHLEGLNVSVRGGVLKFRMLKKKPLSYL